MIPMVSVHELMGNWARPIKYLIKFKDGNEIRIPDEDDLEGTLEATERGKRVNE